jgi:hypothetical protein
VKRIRFLSRKPPIERLAAKLGRLWKEPRDRAQIMDMVVSLDGKYDLGNKLAAEGGVQDIIEQMTGRIARGFGSLAELRGKRVLDIASGSNTSRAPASLYVNSPFRKRSVSPATTGYTALFEPWFCRILLELGAEPVAIDFGNLEGEAFEHHRVDLGEMGALDFLPSGSFDAVQDSRLFGSPEFTAQFPQRDDRLKVAAEIRRQEHRLLKPGGLIIHSDARSLLKEEG